MKSVMNSLSLIIRKGELDYSGRSFVKKCGVTRALVVDDESLNNEGSKLDDKGRERDKEDR